MIRVILLPLLIVGIAGVAFYYLATPALDQIKTLSAERDRINQALQNAAALREVRDNLLARRNSFAPGDLERLTKMLPDHVDNVRLIIDVNNIAQGYGMAIKNIEIATSETPEEAEAAAAAVGDDGAGPFRAERRQLTLSFNVEGSYLTLKSFLADLANSLRLLDLGSLSFTPSPTGVGTSVYQIQLVTYWLE